jgi:hypothetical protein
MHVTRRDRAVVVLANRSMSAAGATASDELFYSNRDPVERFGLGHGGES